MVSLPRYFAVSAISITELLSKEKIDRIVEKTRKADGETVSLLKTDSVLFPFLGSSCHGGSKLERQKNGFSLAVFI